MAIKIWWQDIFPDTEEVMKNFGFADAKMHEDAYNNLAANVKKAAREDTEIVVHHTKHSAYMVNTVYLEMLNNVWVLDGIIQAEKEGYDAAIIGCGNDPGLQQARQAVNIPVIGPTEAGIMLASMLGHKVGVITVADELVPLCERNFRLYGFEWRIAWPVLVYQLGVDPAAGLMEMFTTPENINPQFENLCHQAIANGAETIVPACCALSPATSMINYKEVPDTGVPVVDITQAAVKLAESLVDLFRQTGLHKSQRLWYRSIDNDARDHLRQLAKMVDE